MPRSTTQLVHPDLTPKVAEELRQALLEEGRKILHLYERDVHEGREALSEGTEDLVELANLAYTRELLFSLSDVEREELRLVEEALRRLDTGEYGLCRETGEPIPLRRLRAVPWARYTADVQERLEEGALRQTGEGEEGVEPESGDLA